MAKLQPWQHNQHAAYGDKEVSCFMAKLQPWQHNQHAAHGHKEVEGNINAENLHIVLSWGDVAQWLESQNSNPKTLI